MPKPRGSVAEELDVRKNLWRKEGEEERNSFEEIQNCSEVGEKKVVTPRPRERSHLDLKRGNKRKSRPK